MTDPRARRRRLLLGALGASILAGCAAGLDFSHYDTTRPVPDAGVTTDGGTVIVPSDAGDHVALAALAPFAIRRGTSASLPVTIQRNGIDGDIGVSVTGLPADVTVAPATIAAGASTGVVTFTAGAASALATSNVTVQIALGSVVEDDEPLPISVVQSRLDPTFGDGGIVLGAPNETFQDLDFDRAENVFVAVVAPPAGGLPRARFLIYKVDSTGTATTALQEVDANNHYRISVAPSGDFFAVDLDGQRVSLYSATTGASAWTTTPFDLPHLIFVRIRASADGNVLLLADATLDPTERDGMVLARYLGDSGVPDPSFGDAGFVMLPATAEDDVGSDLLVTDAGTVLCSQRSPDDSDDTSLGLTRFAANGAIDRTFADGGAVVSRAGSDVQCTGLATDGRFIVAAANVTPDLTFAGLARVGVDGTPDPSFGTAGLVSLDALGQGGVYAVAITGDGAGLYSAGFFGVERDGPATATLFDDVGDGGGSNLLFGLDAGGAFPLPIGAMSEAQGVRVLASGSVLFAGSATIDGAPTWFVARLLP